MESDHYHFNLIIIITSKAAHYFKVNKQLYYSYYNNKSFTCNYVEDGLLIIATNKDNAGTGVSKIEAPASSLTVPQPGLSSLSRSYTTVLVSPERSSLPS